MSNKPLQNRLVGLVIVFALAVIILPDLFNNAGYIQEDDYQIIPLRPEVGSRKQAAYFPENFQIDEQASAPSFRIVDDIKRPQVEPLAQTQQTDSQSHLSDVQTIESKTTEHKVIEPSSSSSSAQVGTSQNAQEQTPLWALNLGAFRSKEGAETLLTVLKDAGYNAGMRIIQQQNNPPLHLIFVGPDLDSSTLKGQVQELEQLTGLAGEVVRYQPGNNH